MKIAITGASGLLGRAVSRHLHATGHDVVPLVRRGAAQPPHAAAPAWWDPEAGTVAPGALDGAGAVLHLAGESIAGRRWNREHKQRIRDSRVRGTTAIARAVAAATPRPPALVCASAMGFYGDRAEDTVTEDSAPGTGFLPDTCKEWEASADPARDAGVRVVHVRLGLVLAREGGALAAMLPAFRFGLGGPLGSGRQWMSWIAIEDAARIFVRAMEDDLLVGPVNAVSPEPVRNAEFARTLARTLHRPAFLHVPSAVLRILLGRQMADELLLASARVLPARLQARGHRFQQPRLDTALAEILG